MSDDPTVPSAQLVSTPSLLVLAVLAFAVELALFGGVGAIAYVAVGGGVAGWGWFVGVAGVAVVAAQAVLPGPDGVPEVPGTPAP